MQEAFSQRLIKASHIEARKSTRSQSTYSRKLTSRSQTERASNSERPLFHLPRSLFGSVVSTGDLEGENCLQPLKNEIAMAEFGLSVNRRVSIGMQISKRLDDVASQNLVDWDTEGEHFVMSWLTLLKRGSHRSAVLTHGVRQDGQSQLPREALLLVGLLMGSRW